LIYISYWLSVGDYAPTAVMASATLVFGLLSSVVAARRLFFLAGAAPHASLLAALLAVPTALAVGTSFTVLTGLIGILLVYAVGYAIYRGVDEDIATSLFVSATASLSVILAYLVATRYSLGFDITALVFGDPLLAGREEALSSALVAALVATTLLATYRRQVYIGVDREAAQLAGLRVWFYDWLFFTMLGLGISVLIRSVGFVLEHVLVLIPGAIAGYASSSREALLYATASSCIAGALGLWASRLLNVAPAGATGLVLLALYVLALTLTRE